MTLFLIPYSLFFIPNARCRNTNTNCDENFGFFHEPRELRELLREEIACEKENRENKTETGAEKRRRATCGFFFTERETLTSLFLNSGKKRNEREIHARTETRELQLKVHFLSGSHSDAFLSMHSN